MSPTLDLELVQQLEGISTKQPTPEPHDIQTRRERMECLVRHRMDELPDSPGILVDTLTVKSYDGADILVFRIYPRETSIGEPTAAFIYTYGGGMIAGSAGLFIKHVALTVQETGAQFFSVDYRRAPEHPHPKPVEDVYAALRWLSDSAAAFNVNPRRIGITGESAGGGIAAAVAIMARDRMLSPPLAKQVLIYPMLDDRNLAPIEDIDHQATWKAVDNLTGWSALLGDQVGSVEVSPYAAPARVKSVAGLPPLYVDIGELDIFKMEAVNYVQRFARANISTEFHLYPSLPHGWEGIAPHISATARAKLNRIKALSKV